MIYTSYFAKVRKLPENYKYISICLSSPKGYDGYTYTKLAPNWDILKRYKEDGDQDAYIREFNKLLQRLNPDTVIKELYSMVQDPAATIVLLCYEKPSDFCHRHLVAEWLTNNGYPVMEYQF